MIRVLFFGFIADQRQQRETQLSISQSLTLAELLQQVGCAEIPSLLFAVNQEQVNDLNTMIHDGNEVAIMPPFSGG